MIDRLEAVHALSSQTIVGSHWEAGSLVPEKRDTEHTEG